MHLGLENLERYINAADRSDCDTVQIVTWNDFAEGTCIEPTMQFGNLYPEAIGAWHARRNGGTWIPGQTRLAFHYYCLSRQFGENAAASMKQALLQGDYHKADELGKQLAAANRYQIPRAIGMKNEFPIYQPDSTGK